MNSLSEKREMIDTIDTHIADLLSIRQKFVQNIQIEKARSGMPIIDEDREEEILTRLKREQPEISNTIDAVWNTIFNQSKE